LAIARALRRPRLRISWRGADEDAFKRVGLFDGAPVVDNGAA